MKVRFTAREQEVIDELAQAATRKAIATKLDISIHTVDGHLRNIHRKTNTSTMAELILFFSHNGWGKHHLSKVED